MKAMYFTQTDVALMRLAPAAGKPTFVPSERFCTKFSLVARMAARYGLTLRLQGSENRNLTHSLLTF